MELFTELWDISGLVYFASIVRYHKIQEFLCSQNTYIFLIIIIFKNSLHFLNQLPSVDKLSLLFSGSCLFCFLQLFSVPISGTIYRSFRVFCCCRAALTLCLCLLLLYVACPSRGSWLDVIHPRLSWFFVYIVETLYLLMYFQILLVTVLSFVLDFRLVFFIITSSSFLLFLCRLYIFLKFFYLSFSPPGLFSENKLDFPYRIILALPLLLFSSWLI